LGAKVWVRAWRCCLSYFLKPLSGPGCDWRSDPNENPGPHPHVLAIFWRYGL